MSTEEQRRSEPALGVLAERQPNARVSGHTFVDKVSRGMASSKPEERASLLIQNDISSGRLFFCLDTEYPPVVFSVKRYNAREEKSFYHRHLAATTSELQYPGGGKPSRGYDWRGRSYHFLIHTTWARCSEIRDSKRNEHPPYVRYDAYFLDDPSVDLDNGRTIVVRDDYLSSIIPFRPQRSLKDMLNEKFQQKHADWEPALSLSKIRSLKFKVAKLWHDLDRDLSTVALAIVFFEKLVLKKFVKKDNRKLAMACCLVLSLKFNDPQDGHLEKLWPHVEECLSVSRKQVLKMEFAVFFHLDFSFHVPLSDVMPHFERALQALKINREAYIDDDMWQLHQEARGLADDSDFHNFQHEERGLGGDEERRGGSTGDEGPAGGSGSDGSRL